MPDNASRVIVIKYGGSLLEDAAHQAAFLADVAALAEKEKVILVHGGGKEISKAFAENGIPSEFKDGLRITRTPAAMSVVDSVLRSINQRIVFALNRLGKKATGHNGGSNGVMHARVINAAELGRVGIPGRVDAPALQSILDESVLPVFYSVAPDEHGQLLNVNADDFAQALAIAVHALRLVFMTDSGGVCGRDGKKIEKINKALVEELIADGVISGGMIVKAKASIQAAEQGVRSVDITNSIKYLLPRDTSQQALILNTSFSL